MRRYYIKGFGVAMTVDGAAVGLVTVGSTTPFMVGMTAWLSDDNSTSVRVKIVEIVSSTTMRVQKIWDSTTASGDYRFETVTQFTTAQNGRIDVEPQLVEDISQSA